MGPLEMELGRSAWKIRIASFHRTVPAGMRDDRPGFQSTQKKGGFRFNEIAPAAPRRPREADFPPIPPKFRTLS